MKKPVGRLLYPNTGWYFAAMLLFTAAAAALLFLSARESGRGRFPIGRGRGE